MAGTRTGGKLAAERNKQKYGKDFYSRIGAKGGSISTGGGFAYGAKGKELARKYGAIGGSRSKRTKVT